MKRIAIPALLLSLIVLAVAPAHAAGPAHTSPGVFKILGTGDPVPAEWAGEWTVTDSIYTCGGALQFNSVSTDTLCAGEVFVSDPEFNYSCTGTATATTVNMTCTGSNEIFPGCTANFTVTFVGTRTSDTYFTVVTSTTTFSGTDKECVFPASCTQINSHGVRIGPAPAAYCATPVDQTSWGRVKSQYR